MGDSLRESYRGYSEGYWSLDYRSYGSIEEKMETAPLSVV